MPNEDKTAATLQLSLLRYCPPTEVNEAKEKAKQEQANKTETKMKFPPASWSGVGVGAGTGTGANACATATAAATDDQQPSEIEVLLNEIFPPRRWDENGKQWQQAVSPTPASRDEIVSLEEALDTRLAQTQARGSGLCSVRHGIYSECFDEIIRQATINCPERGLLLLRIRDEMKMTVYACELLYRNAVEFGLRKASQAGKEKEALLNRVNDLADAHTTVQKALEDKKTYFLQTQIRTAETYAAEEKHFEEQLEFAKKSNAQFKLQLESIKASVSQAAKDGKTRKSV